MLPAPGSEAPQNTRVWIAGSGFYSLRPSEDEDSDDAASAEESPTCDAPTITIDGTPLDYTADKIDFRHDVQPSPQTVDGSVIRITFARLLPAGATVVVTCEEEERELTRFTVAAGEDHERPSVPELGAPEVEPGVFGACTCGEEPTATYAIRDAAREPTFVWAVESPVLDFADSSTLGLYGMSSAARMTIRTTRRRSQTLPAPPRGVVRRERSP